jgi:GTP-binding protein Era
VSGQRCGQVAIIGAPNAGKSTLVNALVGEKVAIVSPKVQTTRARLTGIAVEGAAQLLLVDTPGIFHPRRALDRAMVSAAWEGARGADVIACVVDAKTGLRDEPREIVEALAVREEPRFLVLNKTDIAAKDRPLGLAAEANAITPFAATFMISAATGDGVADLKAALAAAMPEGPWAYPADQLTDAATRLVAAELTREQIYARLHAELPYASTVITESWEERKDGSTVIRQQILVERDTQKAIVIGKGGAMLRAIGEAARGEIGKLTGGKVHLFLHVRVEPGWAEDRERWRESGLD